jgi:3'(2'),5'-bisphosphate nucleotidase
MTLLDSLVEAAQAAGERILQVRAGGFAVAHKSDASPVTAADHAAETVLLAWLARLAPEVPVVAEEAVAAGVVPVTGERFFLVDPLDGTREFVAGRDEFTVNVALVERGRPVLGVVHAPALGRCFAGDVAAARAFELRRADDGSNSRRALRVRLPPHGRRVAVASRSHASPETEIWLDAQGISERVSIGSSLKFCLLAAGEADVYPRFGPTMEWDTAAGDAVLAAAGGVVLAADGAALRYGKPGFRNPDFIASADPAGPAPEVRGASH